jgi:hypothetical protein
MASLTRPGQFPHPDDLFRGFLMRPINRGTWTEAAPEMKIEVK